MRAVRRGVHPVGLADVAPGRPPRGGGALYVRMWTNVQGQGEASKAPQGVPTEEVGQDWRFERSLLLSLMSLLYYCIVIIG